MVFSEKYFVYERENMLFYSS